MPFINFSQVHGRVHSWPIKEQTMRVYMHYNVKSTSTSFLNYETKKKMLSERFIFYRHDVKDTKFDNTN